VAIGGALGIVVVLALREGACKPVVLQSVGLLAAYMATMMAGRMLASVVPTRRALHIEPMEALNAE
jgi:hypothetical protein